MLKKSGGVFALPFHHVCISIMTWSCNLYNYMPKKGEKNLSQVGKTSTTYDFQFSLRDSLYLTFGNHLFI